MWNGSVVQDILDAFLSESSDRLEVFSAAEDSSLKNILYFAVRQQESPPISEFHGDGQTWAA